MNERLKLLIMLVLAMLVPGVLWGAGEEPPHVEVEAYGLNVRASAGFKLLELRVAGPDRVLIHEERSRGGGIHWTLRGVEGDGEYRYEAVIVSKQGGKLTQRSRSGGFEVLGGRIDLPKVAEVKSDPDSALRLDDESNTRREQSH